MNTIQYGDYVATLDYDPDMEMFAGRVINTADVITFYGASVADLKRDFEISVRSHLEFCRKQGIEPSKPFSGNLNLRMGPERHREAAIAAAREDVSLNAWLIDAIDRKLMEHDGQR